MTKRQAFTALCATSISMVLAAPAGQAAGKGGQRVTEKEIAAALPGALDAKGKKTVSVSVERMLREVVKCKKDKQCKRDLERIRKFLTGGRYCKIYVGPGKKVSNAQVSGVVGKLLSAKKWPADRQRLAVNLVGSVCK